MSSGSLPTWRHTIVLIGTFSLSVIAAGHGVGPIGLLPALGWNDEWLLQVIFGWVGILVLLLGCALRHRRLWVAQLAGVLSALSWLLFLAKSELIVESVAFSIPYLAALALWFQRTLWNPLRT